MAVLLAFVMVLVAVAVPVLGLLVLLVLRHSPPPSIPEVGVSFRCSFVAWSPPHVAHSGPVFFVAMALAIPAVLYFFPLFLSARTKSAPTLFGIPRVEFPAFAASIARCCFPVTLGMFMLRG